MGGGKKIGRVKDLETEKSKEEKKKEEKPKHAEKAAEVRALVRVANTDLLGEKKIGEAIRGIRGVSYTFAKAVVVAANLPFDAKLSSLNPQQIENIEQILKNPEQFGIPTYLLNRRKEPESGKNIHLVGQDLMTQMRFDVQKQVDLKTYKGFRHMLGQPVRGQRTRAHFRAKGRVVGVMRKAVAAAMGKTVEAAKTGTTVPAVTPTVPVKTEKKIEEKK